MTALRELIRVQLTQRKVAEVVVQGTVLDEEVRKQFDGNRGLYDKPAQIKISHILFRISEKGQEAVAAAKARIAQAKLADGAKLEDVAKASSEDPGSAERGGDLGYVSKGTMVKEFEQAAWALKPGETSGLVRTQYGLHIIRVSDVKPAEKAEFEKVKNEIRDQLLASKREKAFEAWLEGQRKAATVEQFARR
jgi:parvulin-like peptidyl-prolyl isomerase